MVGHYNNLLRTFDSCISLGTLVIYLGILARSFRPLGKIFGDVRLSKALPCKVWQDPKKVLKSYLKKLKKNHFSFLIFKTQNLELKKDLKIFSSIFSLEIKRDTFQRKVIPLSKKSDTFGQEKGYL